MVTGETEVAALFVALLSTIALVAVLVRFVRIPYTVALVLAGVGLALLPDTPQVTLTPSIILTVFLPVLLFYGAYHLDLAELRASLLPVTLLAVPGVIATAGLVGLALHLAAGLTWTDALLFGTIVAATDPVAILTLFGEVGAPRRLSVIVTGESLFNDGTALVFFTAVLGVAVSHSVDAGATVEQFAIAVLGALALGVAVGVVGTAVLRRLDDALLEMAITLLIAYGGYLLAERLGASGPLETVAAGIFLGMSGNTAMSPTTRLQSGATWEFLDFLANSLLFLLMGLELRPIAGDTATRLGLGVWWPLAIAILAVTVARVVVVWLVSRVLRRVGQAFPRGWQTVLSWAGLRGAVALAAALSLPTTLAQRDLLLTLTFGVVLWTILVQGLSIRPLLAALGLVAAETAQRALERALGRLHILHAAQRDVVALREAGAIDEHVAARLSQQFTSQRQTVRAELDVAYAQDPSLEQEHERLTRQHLLHVQHEAARDAYAHGQISRETLRELLTEIDTQLVDLQTTTTTATGTAVPSSQTPA